MVVLKSVRVNAEATAAREKKNSSRGETRIRATELLARAVGVRAADSNDNHAACMMRKLLGRINEMHNIA